VDPIWGHLTTAGIVRDRNATGVFLVLPLTSVQHVDATQFYEGASFYTCFDLGNIEHSNVVHIGLGHIGKRHAHFGTIAGREGVFTLIVAIAVIKIARHHNLPCHGHFVGIDSRVEVYILLRRVQNFAVVDHRHFVFSITEDIFGA
jgi:hypothetical protein